MKISLFAFYVGQAVEVLSRFIVAKKLMIIYKVNGCGHE